jgi:hypothetical protein
MLVDDLCTGPSDQLDHVVVKPFDPAHELDPVHEEHHYLSFTVAKLFEEYVLDHRGPLRSQVRTPWCYGTAHIRLWGIGILGNLSTSTTLVAWGNSRSA